MTFDSLLLWPAVRDRFELVIRRPCCHPLTASAPSILHLPHSNPTENPGRGIIAVGEADHQEICAHAVLEDAPRAQGIPHDWDEANCLRILSAIRRAAAPGARLIVIEDGIAARGQDPSGHNLDVIMLAITGGRERTTTELDDLFAQPAAARQPAQAPERGAAQPEGLMRALTT